VVQEKLPKSQMHRFYTKSFSLLVVHLRELVMQFHILNYYILLTVKPHTEHRYVAQYKLLF